MKDRRANPHGYSQSSHRGWVDALMVIVGIGMAASFGTLVGRIIYRAFLGGV